MEDFQKRVVDEKLALDEKISKLYDFLVSDLFCSLPNDEQFRLRVQIGPMRMYSQILGARIENF